MSSGAVTHRAESPATQAAAPARAAARGTLLYLPWEFDLLAGVDVAVDRLYGFLDRTRPQGVTIGVQDWHRAGPEVDAAGRRFLRINFPQPPASGAGATSWLRYALTLARRLRGIAATLAAQGIGTINFHYVTTNALAPALAKRLGLWPGRIVLSFHGSDALAVEPHSRVWRLIAAAADEVVACSEPLRAELQAMDLFPLPVTVIHNGVDAARLEAQTDERGDPSLPAHFERYLLCVGMYRDVKGQDILLRAFARLGAQARGLGLVFAGATDNGEWLLRLREQTAQLGVADRVVFLENLPQPRVVALMRGAACFVSASRREGFALVLLEAGALGVPVVATRVGGASELLSLPEHGWLVAAEDDRALEAAIGQVLERPAEAARRAALLKARVAERFSVDATGAAYARLLG